jgi:16S rRNA (guanine966-N2)-methyltransferase
MIRVIGGTYKGQRLKRVASPLVRSIPDKLKEALFSILRETIRGRAFLDAFAGTGSVGIEALSRGAEKAVFIEELPQAVRVLKANLAKVGAEDKAVVVAREYNRAVIDLARDGFLFDLVFLDPPYKLLDERNPLKVLRKRRVIGPGGTVILRHHFKTRPPLGDFPLARQVTLGDDTLSFFKPGT